MSINKVQFQHGMSLPTFLAQYGAETACRKALEHARWPSGFVCPKCQTSRHSHFVRDGQKIWQCSACQTQTSLTAGTLFAHSRVPLTTWFLAMYLLGQAKTSLSALALSRHLGVGYRTAWRIKHNLMQSMQERESTRRLQGKVQMDDAYLGGEYNGGKRGRGSPNKRPFVVAVSVTEEGHPRFAAIDPVAGFTGAAISQWATQRLAPSATVYSDGLAAFKAVLEQGHSHVVVPAETPRQGCEDERVRWMNVVLSNLKRSLDGTYHSFAFRKYAQRYLGEFAWRFNRRFELEAIVPRLLVAAARINPWPERALRHLPVFGN